MWCDGSPAFPYVPPTSFLYSACWDTWQSQASARGDPTLPPPPPPIDEVNIVASVCLLQHNKHRLGGRTRSRHA